VSIHDAREAFAETRERFLRETAGHEIEVLMDLSQDEENPQLYRHLRFRSKSSGGYWFDIITTPGNLFFRGDGESFTFSANTDDQLKLFRGRQWRGKYMDVSYCREKLTSNRECVIHYQEELFEKAVREQVEHAIEQEIIPEEHVERLWEELKNEIFESGYPCDEKGAVQCLEDFKFYFDPSKEFDYRHKPDFDFEEWWEWFEQSKGYDWWFLWALCAICWGIEQYDALVGTRAQNTAQQGRNAAEIGQNATVGRNATWGKNTAREGVILG